MSIPKLNPFLVDTVLDLILSDLTIPELKLSREVCQLWDFSSINVISHKDLSSIKLHSGQKSTEQILTEILEFPHRKLFQNFDLNWNQLSEPSLINYLPYFCPIKLTISKSEEFHPESALNLIQILTPIKDTLRELNLTNPGENPDHLTSILTSLATLPGLTLKVFHLLKEDEDSWSFPQDLKHLTLKIQGLFRALENFFGFQSQFLEIFGFGLHCIMEVPWGPWEEIQKGNCISLPVFPRVKTWHFNLRGCLRKKNPRSGDYAWNPWELLEPFDFNVKFPALKKLICEPWSSLLCFSRTLELTRGHPLRSIDSRIYHFPYEQVFKSFPEVEEFTMCPLELDDDGIPWAESLKKLILIGPLDEIEMNLGHLNALEELEIQIQPYNTEEDLDKIFNNLQSIKKLKKFKDLRLVGCKIDSVIIFIEKIGILMGIFLEIWIDFSGSPKNDSRSIPLDTCD